MAGTHFVFNSKVEFEHDTYDDFYCDTYEETPTGVRIVGDESTVFVPWWNVRYVYSIKQTTDRPSFL